MDINDLIYESKTNKIPIKITTTDENISGIVKNSNMQSIEISTDERRPWFSTFVFCRMIEVIEPCIINKAWEEKWKEIFKSYEDEEIKKANELTKANDEFLKHYDRGTSYWKNRNDEDD
jgi:hypothetical protein